MCIRDRVADYRQGVRFLTLDYSEGARPRRYAGKAVGLGDLRCQLLRTPGEIAGSAGRLKGKAAILACPACGGAVSYTHLDVYKRQILGRVHGCGLYPESACRARGMLAK